MRKILFLLLALPSLSHARFNACTGCFDFEGNPPASSNTYVTSVNSSGNAAITGPVTIAAGTNVSVSQSGSTITVNTTGGGGGITGTINAAPTYSVGAYNFAGSSTQISGTSDFQYTSSSNTLAIQAGTAMTLQGHTGANFMKNAGFVIANQHYAYLTASSGNSLSVFDITITTAPILITQVTTNTVPALAGAEGEELSGNYLYITSISSNALIVMDVSTPGSPVAVSSTIDAVNLHGAVHIRIYGNYAYIANFNATAGSEPGMSVWDISNPLAPKFVAGVTDSHLISSTYMQIRFPYLYIANQDTSCDLNIIDISNPKSPTLKKSYVPPACTSTLAAMDFYGQYLYLTGLGNGVLYTINVASPTSPVMTSSYTNTAESFLTPKVVSNKLFMTSTLTHRLFQFSLVTPSSPTLVNVLTDNTNMVQPDDIFPYGNFLLISSHGQGSGTNGGLSIINVGALSVPSVTSGIMQTDEMEITHDLQANRIFTGSLASKVGWIQNELTASTMTAKYVSASTTTVSSATITNLTVTGTCTNCGSGAGGGIVSPGTFTWQNTQGIFVSTLTVSSNTILAGTTDYGPAGNNARLNTDGYFNAGMSYAAGQQAHFDPSGPYFGIGKTPVHEIDVLGNIYASDHMNAPYYANLNTLSNALAINASGANFGAVQNRNGVTWALGYTGSAGSLGTDVLRWDSTPAVNILSSATISGSLGLNVTYGIIAGTITASQVQITSNTILSGATFYQGGPAVISGATFPTDTYTSLGSKILFTNSSDYRTTLPPSITNSGGSGTNNVLTIFGGNGAIVLASTVTAQSTTTFNGDINISSAMLLNGSAGTNGQVLTSGGNRTIPSWTTVSGAGGGIVSPGTFTWSNQFGIQVSTFQVSSNTILGPTTFYQDGTIAQGGSGNTTITEPNGFSGQVWISTSVVTTGHVLVAGSSVTVIDGGVPGTGGSGSGGYLVEPATVTFQLNKGVTGSTATWTGLVQASSNTVLANTTYYQDGTIIMGATTKVAADNDYRLTVSSANATVLFGVKNNGHIVSSGTLPTVGACGTNPTMDPTSTDHVGAIRWAGSATTCVVTFGSAWTGNPFCTGNASGAATVENTYPLSTTSVTFTLSTALTGSTITYRCDGGKAE